MRAKKVKKLAEEILKLTKDKDVTFEELQEIDTIVMVLEMDVSDEYEDWRDAMMY